MNMASPQEIAEKWAKNLQGNVQSYRDGINRVDTSPMEEAAKNVAGYLNGIQEAVASGKYVAGLRRVSLQEWKDKAINVGAARISQGAIAAKPKMSQFLESFLPFLQSGMAKIRAMPKSTLQERIARSVAMQEYNATYRRR